MAVVAKVKSTLTEESKISQCFVLVTVILSMFETRKAEKSSLL